MDDFTDVVYRYISVSKGIRVLYLIDIIHFISVMLWSYQNFYSDPISYPDVFFFCCAII